MGIVLGEQFDDPVPDAVNGIDPGYGTLVNNSGVLWTTSWHSGYPGWGIEGGQGSFAGLAGVPSGLGFGRHTQSVNVGSIPDECAVRWRLAIAGTFPVDKEILELKSVGYDIDHATELISYWKLYVTTDGKLKLVTTGYTSSTETSSAGLYPTDGTWFALQVLVGMGTIQSLHIYVNNVLVMTSSHDMTGVTINPTLLTGECQWFMFFTPCDCATYALVVDDIEVDDSADLIDFPAKFGYTLDPVNVCNAFVTLPATVSRFTFECSSKTFTVTGTNFFQNSTIELTGPDGLPADFTVSGISPTRILLYLNSDPLPGEYCVIVTN